MRELGELALAVGLAEADVVLDGGGVGHEAVLVLHVHGVKHGRSRVGLVVHDVVDVVLTTGHALDVRDLSRADLVVFRDVDDLVTHVQLEGPLRAHAWFGLGMAILLKYYSSLGGFVAIVCFV